MVLHAHQIESNESNFFASIGFFSGGLVLTGPYLGAFLLLPAIAPILRYLVLILFFLGCIKSLNYIAPSPFIRWLHSMIFEGIAIAITALARPLGYLSNQNHSSGPTKGKPILLIHGYLHDASAWFFLKKHLGREGFGPIYTMNLMHPFDSIQDYAERLTQKIDEIEKQTKRTDLTLIGHSMGGLVSLWYATNIAPPGKVASVITIGSPLAGTLAATIALGRNGREMRRGSEFIRKLQEKLKHCETIPFYHIASTTDQIILPCSSAITGLDPKKEYILHDIGHMTLLFSPRVARQIKKWLLSNSTSKMALD